MKRSVPLPIASRVLVFDAGMDGITPCVSSSVTHGGEECLTTMPRSSPALSASSASDLSVSASDSQWMITGHLCSLASSIPLRRTLLDASHISSDTGKCGLPISPRATARPSATSLAASSIPRMSISSALSSP